MNRVILVGRLTADPETRYGEKGAFTKFMLACPRSYRKRDDTPQESDFIPCVSFGRTAEFIEKYFKKGSKILVEGKWKTGSYTTKDGKKVNAHECLIYSVEFAEGRKAGANGSTGAGRTDYTDIPNSLDEYNDVPPFN